MPCSDYVHHLYVLIRSLVNPDGLLCTDHHHNVDEGHKPSYSVGGLMGWGFTYELLKMNHEKPSEQQLRWLSTQSMWVGGRL